MAKSKTKSFDLDNVSGLNDLVFNSPPEKKNKLTIYLTGHTLARLQAVAYGRSLTISALISKLLDEEVKKDVYEKSLANYLELQKIAES